MQKTTGKRLQATGWKTQKSYLIFLIDSHAGGRSQWILQKSSKIRKKLIIEIPKS